MPDTHLVRTKNGKGIHKRDCHYASLGKPWYWAEGKHALTIRLATMDLGYRFCKHCKPLVGLPADAR